WRARQLPRPSSRRLHPCADRHVPGSLWSVEAPDVGGCNPLCCPSRPRGSGGKGRTLSKRPKHARAHRFNSSLDPYGFKNLDFLKAFTVSSGRSFASLRTLGPSEAPGGISPGISVAPA